MKQARGRFLIGPLLCATICSALLQGCASSAVVLAPPDSLTPFKSEAALEPQEEANGRRDFALKPDTQMPIEIARPSIDAKHVHSLPELIDIGQSTNPATRASWERARQAALAVGMAKATYLPIISADALVGYERASQGTPGLQLSSATQPGIDITQNGLPSALVIPSGTITAQGRELLPSLTMKWLLFDFGAREATVDAAKQLSLAANVLFNGSHQKLIHDIAAGFYRYTGTRAHLAIARTSLANSNVLLEAAMARRKRGVATTIEVAQVRQQVAQAKLGVIQAEGAVRDSYRSLLEAMGVSPTLQIVVEDVSGRRLPKAPNLDIDRLIDVALRRRPDVQAAFARLKADQAAVDRARADIAPKIALIGNANKNYGTYTITDSRLPIGVSETTGATNASILLAVTVPIFDGGVRDAQVKAAQSRASAAADELTQLQGNAAKQIVVAYDTLRTSLASHIAATELVSAASITHKAAVEYYANGIGTLSDALAAQNALLQARLAKAKAHSDALVSAVNIAFAVGVLTNSEAAGR